MYNLWYVCGNLCTCLCECVCVCVCIRMAVCVWKFARVFLGVCMGEGGGGNMIYECR